MTDLYIIKVLNIEIVSLDFLIFYFQNIILAII